MTTNSKVDYYKNKGLTRYTIILPLAHKERLDNLGKTYGLNQGEVLEVMLDQMDHTALKPHFEAKAAAKVDGRKGEKEGSKRALISKLKDLTPEQIAALTAQIDQLGGQS
jgi:ribosomal protein S15P/S13E